MPSLIILLILVPALLSVPISYRIRWPFSAVSLAFTAYPSFLMFFTLDTAYCHFIPRSLADYPGPLIAKSSKWWGAYVTVAGDKYRYYTVVMATL
jgi:hypothetical protein